MNDIEVHSLTKRYKDTLAVDSLDLDVAHGELLALLGVNGAGKTTTIKMLSCLLTPTSGEAFLCKKSIIHDKNDVKQLTNISPQETAVARNLTVRENLELMARVYGADKSESRRKADDMTAQFSLGEVLDKKSKTLSGGMQRRLSIAMALISDPKVLFLDEPTLGLDVLARRELWKHVEQLKGNVTVILTTHYLEEAQALSDRIAVMTKGKLRAVGTAQELIDMTGEKNFEDAFVNIASGEGAYE
ncbi:MAG TPA: ATP-binding cassette domain-containing protein [Bacillota bacterium]|nr:ATP-binding cassette domain-containing protein [Bacillota bacterium]